MSDNYKEENQKIYSENMHTMIQNSKFNNCGVVGQYLMKIITELGSSLKELEEMLRDQRSRVYLIGLPLSFFENLNYQAKIPGKDELLEYGLWIEMNGSEALEDFLEKNELFNVDRTLEKTGFLLL